MGIDKKFEDLFINVSSKAALASYYFIGKKDKIELQLLNFILLSNSLIISV